MWPTRKQWNSWTLPSKLTAVGAWVGIVSLLFALLTFVFQSLKTPNNGTTIVDNSSSAVRSHLQMEASGHINVQVTGNSENIQILPLRSLQRIPKAKLRLVDIYLEENFIDVKLKNSGGDSAYVTRALIQIFSDPDIIQKCIKAGAMEYVYSIEFGGQKATTTSSWPVFRYLPFGEDMGRESRDSILKTCNRKATINLSEDEVRRENLLEKLLLSSGQLPLSQIIPRYGGDHFRIRFEFEKTDKGCVPDSLLVRACIFYDGEELLSLPDFKVRPMFEDSRRE